MRSILFDSKQTKFETLTKVASLCAAKGMQHFIISPGSRSAPLTVSFNRCSDLQCRVVMDERAAGFIALGLAQQTRRPAGLICTSGTAALNYGPAVAEAFYQQIPLIIFTADRPPEWIDQQDGQTIHQHDIYGDHCRGHFELPVADRHPDAQRHAERIISEAINRALWPTPGPVHINVPLREPLYPAPNSHLIARTDSKTIQLTPGETVLTQKTWDNLVSDWRQAAQKLVIAGMFPPDSALSAALTRLQQDPTVAVIADITANVSQTGVLAPHAAMILGTKSAPTLKTLQPDLVASFGGPVVSKSLKLFLRKHRPQAHWHIQADGQVIDVFQSLTEVIAVHPRYFFDILTKQDLSSGNRSVSPAAPSYREVWRSLETETHRLLTGFLAETPFSEFSAVYQVMQSLPASSRLQLGNSMPVRYANFIGPPSEQIRINANRGTSGIDGSLSTTVGAALSTDQITTLITGDLAFFYDRNGLWHNHVPSNLRVVVLNNQGGGIFKLIDGPSNLPSAELEEYFFTPHTLTAKNTAADHHCCYFYCDKAADLQQILPEFFAPGRQAAILEIETDSEINTQVFQEFKTRLATIGEGRRWGDGEIGD